MAEIKSFPELDEDELKKLYQFLTTDGRYHYFDSFEEMIDNYLGSTFNYGKSYFILWDSDQVIGTLGAITREAEKSGIIYLTGLNIEQRYSAEFAILLKRLLKEIRKMKIIFNEIKLGLPFKYIYLQDFFRKNNFKKIYRILIMKYSGKEIDFTGRDCRFERVMENNIDEFISVNNEAFQDSPNGGSYVRKELLESTDKFNQLGYTDFYQLGYFKGQPAVAVSLNIHKGEGWIDGLGVKPDYQGNGLGKAGLIQAVKTLRRKNFKDIYLSVVEVNDRALNLYLRMGFVKERVSSIYFSLKNEKRNDRIQENAIWLDEGE